MWKKSVLAGGALVLVLSTAWALHHRVPVHSKKVSWANPVFLSRFITKFMNPAKAEPPGGGGGESGGMSSSKKEEMQKEMSECEAGMKEAMGQLGANFSKSIHFALMQFKERKNFIKMVTAMAKASMCRLNKELTRQGWDGTTVPFEGSMTFPGKESGESMTITMNVYTPTTEDGEGWTDFDQIAIVTVGDTQVLKVAWGGTVSDDEDTDTSKGMFVMNNMHQKMRGITGEEQSVILKWNRTGDDTDDTDLGSSYAVDIFEKVSVTSGANGFSVGTEGSSGMRSHVADVSFRKNANGGFTLKSSSLEQPPEGGANMMAFTMTAISDDGTTGTIAVSGRAGLATTKSDKGVTSDMDVFTVNFANETVTATANRNDFIGRPRFEQRFSPSDMKAVVSADTSSGAGQYFKGSDGGGGDHGANFKKDFNPKDMFKKE